jgi:hypothetical protein
VGEFLFVVVMFVGAFIAGHRLKSRTLRKRKALASALGLKFEQFFMGIADGADGRARSQPGASIFRLLPFATTCRVTGEVNGVRVAVGTGKYVRKGNHTGLAAYFREPLNLELHVVRRAPEERVMDEEFIHTGVDKFDRKVLVQGEPEPAVKSLLTDREVQRVIIEIVDAEGTPTVDDEGVFVDLGGFQNDAAKVRSVLERLTRAVQVIEAAHRRSRRFA